jgi:hypothetical protein
MVKFENIQNSKFSKLEKSPNFEFFKSSNFKYVPKGRSHSRQKHLTGCFQNCTKKTTHFGWLLTFLEAKALLKAQSNSPLKWCSHRILPSFNILLMIPKIPLRPESIIYKRLMSRM